MAGIFGEEPEARDHDLMGGKWRQWALKMLYPSLRAERDAGLLDQEDETLRARLEDEIRRLRAAEAQQNQVVEAEDFSRALHAAIEQELPNLIATAHRRALRWLARRR